MGRGDSKGASGHVRIANTWLTVKRRGRPHPGQAVGTLSVPTDVRIPGRLRERLLASLKTAATDPHAAIALREWSDTRRIHKRRKDTPVTRLYKNYR